MRKVLGLVVGIALVAAGAWYYPSSDSAAAATTNGAAGGPGRGGAGGRGGRPAMPVDTASASRHEIIDYTSVVGNLVGQLTVDVVPRVAGRIEAINVQLGDRVSKGQPIVKIEDRELRLQITQAQASLAVNAATVTQRENDLKVVESAFARTKTSFDNGLISKQALEDVEARVSVAQSQLLVAKSQQAQTEARIDELEVTQSNTQVLSPVDGFVSRRALDPGAFAGANTVILAVVDIRSVKLVANIVERDFKRVKTGIAALVEVDAFPGEHFTGTVSRVAPVFDPATRTAPIEIEVPNPGYRLKPGMYARVRLTVERRDNALTVPRNAVVDAEGKRGVYMIEEDIARFHPVTTGLSDGERMRIASGLSDGERVVTTGATALRDGDRIALVTADQKARGGRGNRTGGTPGSGS